MNGIDLNSKYLIPVSTIIKDILSKSIVEKNINEICSNNVIIQKKVLNKFARIDKEYFLIPKNKIQNHELCVNTSKKYLKKIQLLTTIKYLYDVENIGKNNFASLIFNHIQIDNENNKIKIASCTSKQNKWWWEIEEGLNVYLIPGIKYFVENNLSEKESKIFLGQLKEILKSNNSTKLDKYVCKDDLIKELTYEKLYQTIFHCKSKISKTGGAKTQLVNIAKHNPIISQNMCRTKTIYETKYRLQFKQMIQNMRNNYTKNLKKITKLLNTLVKNENGVYELRNISLKYLNVIDNKVKRTIILFYMQSLMDYKNILNTIRLYR